MAQFRLRLITPNNDRSFSLNDLNTQETFLVSTITDYQDQKVEYQQNKAILTTGTVKHSASYTYNEKVSLHKHGQKELTFNMDDKIFSNNEWIENPYARILRVGTQLELVDKYNNCSLFTVSKVAYQFGNLNITYAVTCQDSFTYQLTRQNQGYTLKNDSSTDDFIGALDIDNWTSRIVKDCYLTYQYIPLDTGIYQDTDGLLHTFEVAGDDLQYSVEPSLQNVAKIIKPIYNKQDYSEYYETVPFSASGSSALSALISLGDLLGLQLNVIEGLKFTPLTTEQESSIDPTLLQPLQYTRFFFFGPTKNNVTTGLTYSPLRDVQNFSLSFAGDSLTTILNVKSTTWENEEIGLLPTMPDFFVAQILTDTSWTKSKYYPGYFLELVKGPRFSNASIFDISHEAFITENPSDPEVERSYTYLVQLNRNELPFWTACYNQIACSWDKEHITEWDYSEVVVTSKTYEMGLATENPHPDIENFYSLYNIWRYVDFEAQPTTWNYTNAYTVRVNTRLYEDQPNGINFSADFHEYTWSFTYMGQNWICTLILDNNIYYIYVMKEIQPGLYEAVPDNFDYDDFINDYLYNQKAFLVLPPSYQGVVEGNPWALWKFFPEYTDIPASLISEYNDGTREFYFYIKHTPFKDSEHRPSNVSTYLRLTRKYTQEEWDFATIAEECPWLENKLINFDYFYKLGIISRAEYENLIDFVTNDLRIINGQLMCYATAYYQSLHKQTKILAELQAATDKLGAIFYADVVEPYSQGGASKLNTGDFAAEYNDLFALTKESDAREPMLRLNNIISDYFNKYFSAEQRFLKNIYNFRKFFKAQNIYSLNCDTHLQDVTYSLICDHDNTGNEKVHVGFNNILKWTKVEQDSPITLAKNYVLGVDEHDEPIINTQYYTNTTIYQWQHGHYVVKKIPGPDNYKEFYVPLFEASKPHQLDAEVTYNPKNTYFLRQDRYRSLFGNESDKITTITYNSAVYVQLDYTHLLQLFLYNNPNKYYIRDKQQKVPLDWVRCDCATIQQAFSIHLWNGLETLNKYICFLLPKENKNLKKELFNTFWSYYKAITPFNSIYIQDFDIQHKISDDNSELVSYTWTINDENHHPYKYNGDHTWLKYDLNTKDYDREHPLTRDQLYTAWYEVSMINFKEALSTIFGTLNASSSSITNLLTISNTLSSWKQAAGYYTKTEKFDWSVVWSNVGNAILGYYPNGWNWPSPWYSEWVPADKTDYSAEEYYWDGTKGVFATPSKNEAIPTDWKNNNYLLGNYTKHYSGDSIWVNYTKSVTAEKEIQELTESLQSTGILNQLYQITTDPRGRRYSVIAWKHYDNYYSKIIATHNLGSWTHDYVKDLDDSNYFNNPNVLNSYNAVTGNNLTYRNMFLYDVHTVLDSYANGLGSACYWDKFWTTNKYARFCTAADVINPNDKYIWVKAVSSDGEEYIFFTDEEYPQPRVTQRFSAIKFYPLVEGKEEININRIFSLEELSNNKFTINDLFARINELEPEHAHTWNTSNNYLFKMDDEGTETRYAILHIEPYEKGIISNDPTFYNNPTDYKINYKDIVGTTTVYEIAHGSGYSDLPLKVADLTIKPFLSSGVPTNEILVLSEEDTQLVQVEKLQTLINEINENRAEGDEITYSDPWIDDIDGTTHWYETDSTDSRTYTLKQSFGDDAPVDYFFLGNNLLHTSEFNKNNQSTTQSFSIFVTKYHIDENDTVIIDNSTNSYTIQIDVKGGMTVTQTSDPLPVDDFNVQLIRTVNTDYDISQMSNGEFWYRFHNRLDIPQLLEKVVVIETELTNYWTQAYTASQYCEWFLPPTWTVEQENNTNYFSGLLYTIQKNDKLELLNNILPEVEIYSYGGKTLLPAYIYHYIGDNNLTTGDTFIEDTAYLKDNPAIINAINHILSEEDSEYKNNVYNFTAQENGLTTYYYVVGGGLQYKDVLHTINNTEAIYPKFDGLYIMQLHILLTKYVESSSTQYETLLDKKLTIWRHLYARFPGIFLENVYENKDARSSLQLLQMAQLAFKDYTSPEKQYNITVIDAEALDGYNGQELRIGDGILLKSSDYYDAVDETYRALNQYLFISDISYTLRQDTDIALTVNTIKYQDKLLQSIVKLIR